MTTLPTDRLRDMLAAAEKATPGPWKAVSRPNLSNGYTYTSVQPVDANPETMRHLLMASGEYHVCRMTHTPLERQYDLYRRDATHIALCDPSTIASLVTELLALRGALESIQAACLSEDGNDQVEHIFELAWPMRSHATLRRTTTSSAATARPMSARRGT